MRGCVPHNPLEPIVYDLYSRRQCPSYPLLFHLVPAPDFRIFDIRPGLGFALLDQGRHGAGQGLGPDVRSRQDRWKSGWRHDKVIFNGGQLTMLSFLFVSHSPALETLGPM